MKIVINEDICKKHNISLKEVLGILFLHECEGDIEDTLNKLIAEEKAIIEEGTNKIFPTQHWSDEVQTILLEKDEEVPKETRIVALAKAMRNIFPTGMKYGSSAWKGNVRELVLRLQKFFKLYGDYSDEDIINATQRYVDSFNGNYTYMRILKYFILKHERKTNEEGIGYIEDTSDLANFLENKETEKSEDWQSNMI